MRQITVHQAKTHLSRLLREVEAGDEIVIARGTTPVARLVPFETTGRRRTLDTARGLVTMSDDFDAPLPGFEEYLG